MREEINRKNSKIIDEKVGNKKIQKLKSKKNTKASKGKKIAKRIALGIFACIFLVGAFFAIKYGKMVLQYKKEAESLVTKGGSEVFRNTLTSTVYDANGEVITKLSGSRDSYYLSIDEIPYVVRRAFIASEDRKFYEHSGVDYSAVGRAFLALVENEGEVTQGGSTITQQLARNIYLSKEVSIERKLKEIFIAWELEDIYSKDEILEFYINNIYFGNGLYGIEAASWGYFNKPVVELDISQMIFLCAIPNNPTLYDPIVNIDNTLKRRDRILKQMKELGEIDQNLYIQAINENIVLSISEKIVNNYEETFIRYCATIELMKRDSFVFRNSFVDKEDEDAYNEMYQQKYSECNSRLFTGGYDIYTSIDMDIQDELQKSLDVILGGYTDTNDEGAYTFQGSATCIDNATGLVVAIVGGRSQETKGYTLNRAYQSHRQPGSSIKPLLVYTPLFERGYTPDTQVMDEWFQGGPKNATGTYAGRMRLRSAVEQSVNTVAWKLFESLGVNTGIQYLLDMNFNKIVKNDYVPSVAIGGFTYGMSSLEMASGFSTIENDGVYRTATCIRKIVNSRGEVIVDNVANISGAKQIYETNAARMMTNVLQGVFTSGTGRNYRIENAICAGKTGTTNDIKDVWFVGYSHYYTTAVWCGYDLPKEITDGYGNTCAGLIWKNFMEVIHEGKEKVNFPPFVDTGSKFPVYEEETTTQEPTIDNEIYIPDETTGFENYTTISGEEGMYTEAD